MTLPLDSLEAVARAASPGKWMERMWHGPLDGERHITAHGPLYLFTDENISKVARDMEFIAAFDPPTCLALIAEIRRCHARLKEWEEEESHEALSCHVSNEKLDRYRAALEKIASLGGASPGDKKHEIAREALDSDVSRNS